MLLQLSPAIPVEVIENNLTPSGKGMALLVIDYSQEHDLIWVVAFDASREIWGVRNQDVRVQANATLGRAVELTWLVKK